MALVLCEQLFVRTWLFPLCPPHQRNVIHGYAYRRRCFDFLLGTFAVEVSTDHCMRTLDPNPANRKKNKEKWLSA